MMEDFTDKIKATGNVRGFWEDKERVRDEQSSKSKTQKY